MKKKNNTQKVCSYGRIITDPKNKTGFCPNCQKDINCIFAGVGAIGILVVAKKYGPQFAKNAINLAKNLKK